MSVNSVTVTMTACDRLDLLEKTLKSFFAFNTYPIERFLVRDDSGLEKVWRQTMDLISKMGIPVEVMGVGQLGQAASIDEMLNLVYTKYVFHLEDDWVFFRRGFIEDCLSVFDEKTAQVWVRDRNDGVVAKVGEHQERGGVGFGVVENHNFSLNPHLRLMSDMRFTGKNETMMSEWVRESGLHTLWLEDGYCRHTGWEKTTNRPGTPYQSGVVKA